MREAEKDAIEQVLAGDRDAYRVLVDRHYQIAFRIAFRITGNASDAEEVTQEAFLRGFMNLSSFRQDAAFSTWINRIAMNQAINFVERRTREVSHAREPEQAERVRDQQAGPERMLLNQEAETLRKAAMETLTPMERTAFTLRHMEEMPIAEIAAALRVPANSAKQAVFRAVSKLRAALAPTAAGGAR